MRTLLFTRMLLIKKQAFSTFIWLVMPLVLTTVLIHWMTDVVEDGQVPVAIVDEDNSELSKAFIQELQQIDLLNIQLMSKQKALYALEKNQIDSVFIVKRHFEKQLRNNKRHHLIEAYSTNRSYFYFAVKENISSLAQRKATQAKAAHEVKKLLNKYESDIHWSFDQIVAEGEQREERYELLTVDFSFYNESSTPTKKDVLLSPWGIWAFFALISTFYLLDWIIKESNHPVVVRWLQTKISYTTYFFNTLGFYLLFMFGIDFLTYQLLETKFVWFEFLAIVIFRLSCVALALFVAVHMKHTLSYHFITPIITLLLTFLGGAFIPIEQLVVKWPLLSGISPVYALLQWDVSLIWSIFIVLVCIYVYRKESSRFA
ncbi:ABC transporter permease [Solibacillus daqui]|uniref:ABC transporter permease n=1 Tax=Solibacillus daqui TaxID=2912187 RepID=UPI0023663F28|nr:ABC transporter permease [Solibacillus daqui]